MPPRVLLFAQLPLWPLTQGYRVHGLNTARALAQQGCDVLISTMVPTDFSGDHALNRWALQHAAAWPTANAEQIHAVRNLWSGGISRRVARHQGLDADVFAGLIPLCQTHGFDLVIALGQHGPALLSPLRTLSQPPTCLWYAADDPVSFALSCARRESPRRWPHRARQAAVSLGLQRSFGPAVHAVVGVTPQDTAALQRWTRAPHAQTLRNGVDVEHFSPVAAVPGDDTNLMTDARIPRAAFWGSLAFEPNRDALRWWLRRVWPHVRQVVPNAVFDIYGKGGQDDPVLQAAQGRHGITLHGYVEDLPTALQLTSHATAAVMPFRCGLGIKNKLLEAAALGLPIVASRRAVKGLTYNPAAPPFDVCPRRRDMVTSLVNLWSSPAHAQQLGEAARAWVTKNHTWAAVAQGVRSLHTRNMPTITQDVRSAHVAREAA